MNYEEAMIGRFHQHCNAWTKADEGWDEGDLLTRDYVYQIYKVISYKHDEKLFIHIRCLVNDELGHYELFGIFDDELLLLDAQVDTEWRNIGHLDYDHENRESFFRFTNPPD